MFSQPAILYACSALRLNSINYVLELQYHTILGRSTQFDLIDKSLWYNDKVLKHMHLYVLVIIFDELNNVLNTLMKRNSKLSPGSKLSCFYVILLKYLQSTVHNDFTITSKTKGEMNIEIMQWCKRKRGNS